MHLMVFKLNLNFFLFKFKNSCSKGLKHTFAGTFGRRPKF